MNSQASGSRSSGNQSGHQHSVIWIGEEEALAAEIAAEAPLVDIVWECDIQRAVRLPLHKFDAMVVDSGGVNGALDQLEKLSARPRLPPILVRLDAPEPDARDALLTGGAAAIVEYGSDRNHDNFSLIEHLDLLLEGSPVVIENALPRKFVGTSEPMRDVFSLVTHASRSRVTVLITGETGTGKELLARSVHAQSRRNLHPFVAINCAAFPETLLESELFGYVQGAFTGADENRRGLFERANRGTLFLDEIGETTPAFQAKLLRVLQEREIRPIGSLTARRIDVRVVAATNRDLRREAERGKFREDLYYRLAVFPIHLPPLRDRRGDIGALAKHFLELHAAHEGEPPKLLTPEAEWLLESHRWPGNVRELENEVSRALALSESQLLDVEHFSTRVATVIEPIEAVFEEGETLRETIFRIERWLIRQALSVNGGQRTVTAKKLGLTREGLYKKMKRLGIE